VAGKNLADPKVVEAFYNEDLFEVREVHEPDIDELAKGKRGLINRLKSSLKKENKPKPDKEKVDPCWLLG
jgi:hypothetical protein